MHPGGPQGVPRLIHELLMASSFLIGLCWILRPWPSRSWAIAFVVWADIALAIAGWTYSAPTMRLSATMHMALVGIFAALVLGWRVLMAHCAFAFMVFSSITLWNIHTGAATFLDQFFYNSPALTTVVLLPILIQAVIEGAQRSVRATASAAYRDPLTGLLNRRGIQAAIDRALRRSAEPTAIAVIAVDIDHFKEFNDMYGHSAGDSALSTVGNMLTASVRAGDIAGRAGGDEFIVITFPAQSENIDDTVQRIQHLPLSVEGKDISISVGAAWGNTSDSDFDIESLIRQADIKLYEIKRARKIKERVVPQLGRKIQ
ncbi:Probable diguanylate cyclase YcdT [Mycobacteroides abscessus subsp. bolletii]|nr:Probable diguanylate cyclase YcdT [Mycobacteroides abscessus subsp. bolletii]SHW19666.1 Probable diguanylate cyclase YcdT [Mycobacteroides abscessus subsp. bolletii]SHW51516.1 Probable diguanylate cyclase YcdT [Mycobacteroides abscessus subsp. bolletii]SHX13664.1 Probable diguanylate cyclase YcdT [Mycobacteroides abscessus subsp. bolletii]SKS06562.1 Probable diguanylate cyclase YcdT [Mycobacteroides abscessus subsp. bolletii]